MRYQSAIFDRLTYYSAYGGVADYCDEHVCLSVRLSVCLSVRDHISGSTRPIFTKFFLYVLPMAVARSSFVSVAIC